MNTKVLTSIALIATKHTQGQIINCEFPCEFRGQTFDIFFGQSTLRGNWTFENDGETSSYTLISGTGSTTDVLTCHQRVERFIIFRVNNDERFVCYIFDNIGMAPISFSFGAGASLSTSTPDECNLCNPNGGFDPLLALESGSIPSNTASLPCGTVSSCGSSNPCSASDTLPEGCTLTTISTTEATTTKTTTAATTKPTKPCHRRKHHH